MRLLWAAGELLADVSGRLRYLALGPEELQDVAHTPASLSDSLDALERDHKFLLKGDVFTEDAIRMWLDYKRENELDPISTRPNPYEFVLYFDI